MDPKNLPEDLSKISDEELAEIRATIAARAEDIAESESLSDADIDEIAALADAGDAVRAEQDKRAGDAQARQERLQSAMSRIKGEAGGEVVDDGETSEVVDGETVDATEPVPAAANATAAAAPPANPAAASTGRVANLANRRPNAAKPKVSASGREFMKATAFADSVKEGHQYADTLAIATEIVKKRNSWTHIPDGVHDEQVSIAAGLKSGIDESVGGDAQQNFSILRRVQANKQTLVASGETCFPPLSPLYDFFRLAEPQNPVEDSIAVVQAPRGGIRYLVSPDTAAALATTADAFDFVDPDRDYTGETVQDTSGPKSCATVPCAQPAEEFVTGLSQCITFDNLTYRVFPEQVEAFLEDVAVAFASKKEVFYLDYIDTHSTAVTSDFGLGISRGLLADWTRAASKYRKRHGMRRDAPIEVLAPDWAMDAIKLDMALDQYRGVDAWQITDEQAIAGLRARDLNVTWYNDSPTSAGSGAKNQKWNQAQATGGLADWPDVVIAYFFAPGTFVRLDGGTLDVGLVRDSVLNGTNDLQLFMEEWLGMAKLGFESIRLESVVQVDAGAPCCVDFARAV